MTKKTQNEMIVGLDIGTTKVVAIIAEIDEAGELEVIGLGSHASRGMKKGVVVDIESTVQSIQRAVEEAELMADCQVHSVYAGIAGNHIKGWNSSGMVAIKDKDEVSIGDVERVVDAAQAVRIPDEQAVLHVLPQEFIIDQQEGIREPVGMSGIRLNAKVHLVTAAESAVQNIEKCIHRCGLETDDVILEPLASAYAVLTDDEKELGVCLIDIGGGTTDIAVFTEGAIRHTAVIPIAGDQVTNDIAVAIRTPTQQAEEIKIRYGGALRKMVASEEEFEVLGVGDRAASKLSRQTLISVIEPRIEELFILVQSELRHAGYLELLGSGIVLTGGTSRIEGAAELAEEIYQMPVRIGSPAKVKGLTEVVNNPIYSTGVGLLVYGLQNRANGISGGSSGDGVVARIKRWLSQL